MSLLTRFSIALLKSITLGVVVAGMLLLIFPEFRQGQGLNLHWFNKEENIPPRVSYFDALANSAPAVVNLYSFTIDNSNRLFKSRTFEPTNLGSAVIMREDGHLLTCYHVIRDADSIQVRMQDGRFLPAQLVGFDEITDLAVLRIFDTELPVIPQMKEPNIRVGDLVMAIGNPLDLGQTITSGIVSRVGREGLATFDFVQTDAVLNPGNSGGALVDSNGYLVGITNANFKTVDSRRRVQDVNGVNFAVPYPLAKRVMNEIIENGTVKRGHLGFTGGERLTERKSPNLNIASFENTGILVTDVALNGPADIAGLRINDILLSIDGVQVNDLSATQDIIAETPPGSQLTLIVSRDEQLISMTVTVGELSPNPLSRRS